MQVIRDKDVLAGTIVNMHDQHALALDDKEDKLNQLPKRELSSFVESLTSEKVQSKGVCTTLVIKSPSNGLSVFGCC